MMFKHDNIAMHIDNADRAETDTAATAEALIAIAKIMYNKMRADCYTGTRR